MARKIKHPEHVNHERWLVSYADFITLLFAFFTVLYATSQTDSKKVNKFVGAVERALDIGIFPAGNNSVMLNTKNPQSSDEVNVDLNLNMNDAEHKVRELVRALGMGKSVSTEQTKEGLMVSFQTLGFFQPGSDDLNPVAEEFLLHLKNLLGPYPNLIRVEGHTDDTPVRNQRFRSNWELSASRAISVVEFLSKAGMNPARFSAAGYAQYRPVASNNTVQGRAWNRRVDMVISKTKILEPEKEKRVWRLSEWEKIYRSEPPKVEKNDIHLE